MKSKLLFSLVAATALATIFSSPAIAAPRGGGRSHSMKIDANPHPKPVPVRPYFKRDGTYVEGYKRALPNTLPRK